MYIVYGQSLIEIIQFTENRALLSVIMRMCFLRACDTQDSSYHMSNYASSTFRLR